MVEAPALWRRFVALLSAQLKQGITPEKIALTIALGIALGIFPILGACTVLCAITGIVLRLNQPIIQAVNYFAYPAQLLLLIPFYRAGEDLFHQPHVPILSVTEMLSRFQAGPLQFLRDYGMAGLYGITVWCLLAPVLVVAIYFPLRPLLRRLHVGQTPSI